MSTMTIPQTDRTSGTTNRVGATLPLDALHETGTYVCNWSGHLLRVHDANREGDRFVAAGRRAAGAWTITRISADKKTGVVTLSVETTVPELSQAVAGQYLAQLEDFNRHQRRSQARENADYLNRQMAQTKTELETAEDELQVFRQYNSDWPVSSDAGLVKELSRLQRAVEVKTQTYLYLSREYESAQLEAQKDIPIVSILDKPSLPTVKSGPHRSIIVLLAGGVAFMGTLFFLALTTALSGRLPGPHQLRWTDLRRETAEAFPRMTRLAGRLRRDQPQPAVVDD